MSTMRVIQSPVERTCWVFLDAFRAADAVMVCVMVVFLGFRSLASLTFGGSVTVWTVQTSSFSTCFCTMVNTMENTMMTTVSAVEMAAP